MKISDTKMTSDLTRHFATAWPVEDEPTLWTVTWLPGRSLTRNQAVTAMTIAEVVAACDLTDSSDPIWGHIDGWAAELFISGPQAVTEASLPPEDHQAPRAEWPPAGTLPGSAAQRPSPLVVIAGQLEEAYQAGLSQAPAAAPETYPGMTGALSAVALDGAEQLARIRAVLDAFDWETGDRQHALEAIDAIVNGDEKSGDDADDGPEPYCTSCGADTGIFWGHGDGWHHWRAADGGRTEIYDAGHAPVIGWREAGSR